MTRPGTDPPNHDLLEGAPAAGWAAAWGRRTAAQRRRVLAAVLVPMTVGALLVFGPAVRGWWDERAQQDVTSVEAELRVDGSSTAWSPEGRGRVDYVLVLRNTAPRPTRVRTVRLAGNGLAISGRGRRDEQVQPGQVAFVPLSVQLDCRRWRPEVRGGALTGEVGVITASGRSARVRTSVRDAAPLPGVARTLCGLDPQLRPRELSGPV